MCLGYLDQFLSPCGERLGFEPIEFPFQSLSASVCSPNSGQSQEHLFSSIQRVSAIYQNQEHG